MTSTTTLLNASSSSSSGRPARWHRLRVVAIPMLAASAALAVVVAATATPAAASSGTEGRRAQLDKLARELVDAGAPGVVLRVDDGRGRPVEIARQAGWTRPDHVLAAGDEFREG